jgi:hypothetical protein
MNFTKHTSTSIIEKYQKKKRDGTVIFEIQHTLGKFYYLKQDFKHEGDKSKLDYLNSFTKDPERIITEIDYNNWKMVFFYKFETDKLTFLLDFTPDEEDCEFLSQIETSFTNMSIKLPKEIIYENHGNVAWMNRFINELCIYINATCEEDSDEDAIEEELYAAYSFKLAMTADEALEREQTYDYIRFNPSTKQTIFQFKHTLGKFTSLLYKSNKGDEDSKNKINFLNSFMKDPKELITEENFEMWKLTGKYKL